MIVFEIPGMERIEIKNIVFDYNGTLALDGILISEVKERIIALEKQNVQIFVLTADTYGNVEEQCSGLPIKLEYFDKENAGERKREIVKALGFENTLSVGNGRNDVEMFKQSILSIAVIGGEGCFGKAAMTADIIVRDPVDAINLILKPNRMKATLRN